MIRRLTSIGGSKKIILAALLAAGAIGVLRTGQNAAPELAAVSGSARSLPRNSSRLISVQPLPSMDGPLCRVEPASAQQSLIAALQQTALNAPADASKSRSSDVVDRPPERVIRDTYPTYSAIAMDQRTGEVMMEDENLFGIRVFNRLDNTPAKAAFTEPKRVLSGPQTKLEFNCGLYVDPVSGDVYSVNNDTTDDIVVFPYGAEGNRPPSRELHVPHGSYGIAVDEGAQEMYVTVEHQDSIVVYRKTAQGEDKPLRTLEGPSTRMEDPHGIGLDIKDKLMFVTNHGNARAGVPPNTYGRFDLPSITVYPLGSQGDAAPVRVIKGPKTQLNWPAHVWVDEDRGEFYVANDAGDSVLVFHTSDSGDVAPTRMIHGAKTQLKNPMGVFLDAKNDELWVSNMGNHRATVFARTANGDVEPKRVIRSAPAEKLALAIGNPGAVGYDSKREEILVPN
jgi:DNA-binding beta-propeller fold protein YncE